MPVANSLGKDGFLVRAGLGGTVRQANFVAAAALKRGDFVVLSSGQAAQAIAAPSVNSLSLSGGGTALLGVCLGDVASGDTAPIALADDNLEVHVRIMHGTASSAEQQDVTTGTNYQLGRYTGPSAGECFYGMGTTTTNGELCLTEKSLESASDDDYGFVWVKVTAAYRAMK